MFGRRGSFRGVQLDSGGDRRGSISSSTAAPLLPQRRRGSITASAAAHEAAAAAASCAAASRRGSISSSAESAAGGKRGNVSSNGNGSSSSRITGGGGTLAMIALPIPAPRVRKVPILVEREANNIQSSEGKKQKEEIPEQKEKGDGGNWKARTGLSPGKWSTRSLRRSKEEVGEAKVPPLQRRNSLRGSLRLGRKEEDEDGRSSGWKRGKEEEENKQVQKNNGKKKQEGGEVRQKGGEKDRRPLSDLNKAERERKQGERKPLADLNQTGARRASISGPHQQVRTQRVELKFGAARPGLGSRAPPQHPPPRQPDRPGDPPQIQEGRGKSESNSHQGQTKSQTSGGGRHSLSRAIGGRRESEGGLLAPALLRTIQPAAAKEVKEVVGTLRRVGSTGELGRSQFGSNNSQGMKLMQGSTSFPTSQQPNFLSSFSRSLSTLPALPMALPAYFRPPEPAPAPVPLSLSISDLESTPPPPTRPPRLSSSSSSSLSSLPSPPSSTSPTFSLLPHPASCVGILKTPGRRKMSTKHVDFMENIAEREFIRDCDITDSDIRDI